MGRTNEQLAKHLLLLGAEALDLWIEELCPADQPFDDPPSEPILRVVSARDKLVDALELLGVNTARENAGDY